MIYIDCTEVVHNPYRNTGIQRVVRNVVGRLNSDEEIQAVVLLGFGFVAAGELPVLCFAQGDQSQSDFMPFSLSRVLREFVLKHKWLQCLSHGFIFDLFKLCRNSLRRTYYFFLRLIYWNKLIKMQQGDVLVLLDSNWGREVIDTARSMKNKRVKIIPVVYDLIPIDFPQYVDKNHCIIFEAWLKDVIAVSSALLSISQYAQESVRQYSSAHSNMSLPTDYFYLGADLNGELLSGSCRKEVIELCLEKIILAVGSIEPRKRYDVIVDGFRRSGLADEGYILVCIGRVGWKVDQFISAIKSADDYERSLFLLQDISDSELACFYDACELLVFASDVEGFGLPLVEARMKGKRVLASDIPVFREIADHGVSFFEAGNALSLAEKLPETLAMQDSPGIMEWMTWDEASQQFLSKIKNIVSLLDQKEPQ